MSKTHEYGCKKCGGVIKIEVHASTERVDIKAKDAMVCDHSGTVEFQCKKCRKAVVTLALVQAR